MKFSCNISLKFSRRQNFMKSYITSCDKLTTTHYFFKNIVLRTWRTTQYLLKK